MDMGNKLNQCYIWSDITPKNIRERMFTCVITLNASALFAYLLSSIGNICGELFK